MTPDIITLVLSLPLPVRLALLDAGINAPGWPVSGTYRTAGNPIVLEPAGAKKFREDMERFGAAWLPCNPRAIERHAQRLYRARLVSLPPVEVVVRSDGATSSRLPEGAADIQYRYHRALRVAVTPDPDSTSERDYMNAIALLREVVG